MRKANLINELHWKTIHHLLNHNDVIVYGDIKSHGIAQKGNNRTLHRDINNLKFFQFKQRLLFKASEKQKKLFASQKNTQLKRVVSVEHGIIQRNRKYIHAHHVIYG